MIRAVSASDYEFREGYQHAVASPIYEDQLLQHESTVDIDAIRQYNETHGRKSKKDDEMSEKGDRQATPGGLKQGLSIENIQKTRY